jgi:SAM-dependent methyltransferase
MRSLPISQAELEARLAGHVDDLLQLWWDEQGASKPSDLELIARVLPIPRTEPIRVLDLCCGPGDAGRAIRHIYPQAHIDCIDRDPFLLSLCAAANRRAGIPGRIVIKDLTADDWLVDVARDYDVVTVVNALHWFDSTRAASVVQQIKGLVREGGVFICAEPAVAAGPFRTGFEEWTATRPPRYTRENWQRFWSRANAVLGCDHTLLLGPRQDAHTPTVTGWLERVEQAGFALVDVLFRDADQVIIGAVK